MANKDAVDTRRSERAAGKCQLRFGPSQRSEQMASSSLLAEDAGLRFVYLFTSSQYVGQLALNLTSRRRRSASGTSSGYRHLSVDESGPSLKTGQ